MNVEELNELMLKIKEKYNYDDNFSIILRKIIVGMVIYYGEDKKDIIFEALLNTPIVLCGKGENIYDIVVKYGHYNEADKGVVKAGDLKRASGISSTHQEISYNNTTGEYEIDSINNVVALANYIDVEKNPSVLIHELGHLVKGYLNSAFIKGNKLYVKSGMIESVYELSHDNGKVKKRLISEKGVGVEEGTNTYDESEIMKRFFDNNYKSSGYGAVLNCANMLYDDLLLEKELHDVQFFGNKAEFISMYDGVCQEESYEIVEKQIDEIYELNLLAFSQIFETEKMKSTYSIINQKTDELIPELKKYYSKMEKNINI